MRPNRICLPENAESQWGFWEVQRRGGVITGVNDDTPNRGAVASNPLGCAVHCYEDMRVGAYSVIA